MTGLLVRNDGEKKAVTDAFEKEGFPVEYVDQYKTLAGQGGEDGRNDVVYDMKGDIMKAAIHQYHLSGLFHWADDYFANNSEIVPEEKYYLFDSK